jgi:hypothetical protein
MTVEKYSVWTIGYPSKYLFQKNIRPSYRAGLIFYFAKYYYSKDLQSDHKRKIGLFQVIIQRFLIQLILLPFSFPVMIGVILFGMNDSVRKVLQDDRLKKVIKSKAQKTLQKLDINDTKISGGNFRVLYHFALENFGAHRLKMQNYVALYGFCRTITLITTLLFWWFLFKNYEQIGTLIFWHGLTILACITTFFYLAFNKFYRKFTLECYMAITSSKF